MLSRFVALCVSLTLKPSLLQCRGVLLVNPEPDPNQPTSCSAGTTAAQYCGGTGTDMRCGQQKPPDATDRGVVAQGDPQAGSNGMDYDGSVRLSDYPQGRIEVFRDGQWGTVCGHWCVSRPRSAFVVHLTRGCRTQVLGQLGRC